MQHANNSISALEDHLGFWLRSVSNQVSLRFQQQLEQHDISVAEWVAMRTLYQHDSTSHSVLMKAVGMTKGATSKVVSKLVQKALVTRFYREGDTREQSLKLTEKGHQLIPLLAQIADQNDTFFFGQLSTQQREQLIALMQLLVKQHQIIQIPIQ